MTVYIDYFTCNEDVANCFSGSTIVETVEKKDILDLLNASEVLLAWYGGGDHDGHAIVVYRHNGVLYEVEGSHCSCYGLQGQWSPQVINYKYLNKYDPKCIDSNEDFIMVYNEMLLILKKELDETLSI